MKQMGEGDRYEIKDVYVVRNGLKSHKKNKKTVFDILGVCYKLTLSQTNVAA